MQFLNSQPALLVENLALDEALLLEAEAGRGGPVLRLWEWPRPAIVLGSGSVLRDDVDELACRADQVPILRRSSGGGTVLLGKGCLLYTLILAYESSPFLREIRPSYRYILGRMSEALHHLVPGVEQAGVSDLTSSSRKFSGNSQQRKRNYLLHHGTLLHDFDLSLLSRYLREPPRRPEYRGDRLHREFVMNLPCPGEELRRRLRLAWQAEDEIQDYPLSLIQQLVTDKYSREEWVRRR